METYSIDADRAAYHKLLDILYVGYGLGSLDSCCSLEDTPSGITVMYDENGSFAGAEIPFFSERFGDFPVVIEIDSVVPFGLSVSSAADF